MNIIKFELENATTMILNAAFQDSIINELISDNRIDEETVDLLRENAKSGIYSTLCNLFGYSEEEIDSMPDLLNTSRKRKSKKQYSLSSEEESLFFNEAKRIQGMKEQLHYAQDLLEKEMEKHLGRNLREIPFRFTTDDKDFNEFIEFFDKDGLRSAIRLCMDSSIDKYTTVEEVYETYKDNAISESMEKEVFMSKIENIKALNKQVNREITLFLERMQSQISIPLSNIHFNGKKYLDNLEIAAKLALRGDEETTIDDVYRKYALAVNKYKTEVIK